MRIGLSTSVMQRGQSGIGQYLLALIRALLACSEEHSFILYVLRKDVPLFEFARDRAQIFPVSEWFRPPLRDILWHQAELPRLARRHRLDVLHVPSYRRLLWARPCPKVATIHDLAPFRVARKYDWKRMLYGRVVAAQLARRQDEIIAVSGATAADIRRYFRCEPSRLTVVHNGVAHERFHPGPTHSAKAMVARQFGLDAPFFLYLARLEHPGKNHLRLIEAFELFKIAARQPWQLVLAGSDCHGAEIIHQRIGRSPAAQDIRCLGFVPDALIPGLLRAATVFVYPSLYEGFGLPPVEAMACGCPVISSTRGALAEVLGEAAATVDPEDAAGLAWQLQRLASDPALRERLRLAGFVQAEKFNWRRTARETLRIYDRCVKRAPQPVNQPALDRSQPFGI